MFLSRSTSRLNIISKLEGIKGSGRSNKDRRDLKGHKRGIKTNKGIGFRIG